MSISAPDLEIVPTGVSPAYWCRLTKGGAVYQPAEVVRPDREDSDAKAIAWLDMLLYGGILMPRRSSNTKELCRPITLLISGPPGSGKTTLAAELCHRLATGPGLNSLYMSTDQDTARLITNAKSILGQAEEFEPHSRETTQRSPGTQRGVVRIQGRDRIDDDIWRQVRQAGKHLVVGVLEAGLIIWGHVHLVMVKGASRRHDGSLPHNLPKEPDVIVLDGLNSVAPSEQADVFEDYLRQAAGVRLLVFILDSSPDGQSPRPWEYACDLVIDLDYRVQNDYFVRTLQIVKARYQAHVWGKHQVKPHKPEPQALAKGATPQQAEQHAAQMRRDHPYRTSGGTLIYPSIHYYLSRYKRRGPAHGSGRAETYPTWLNDELGGMPEGRCTALIGARGGHKSHLAYTHLLHRIVKHKEYGIIVSLRDDEETTRNTLKQILVHEFPDTACPSDLAADFYLQDLEIKDQLEILYYHPGYITAEEFVHRLYMSLHRVKDTMRGPIKDGRQPKLSVLVNSLDQLQSRFPLCARESIFVPGMIEMLTYEGVTSLFVAVTEPGQPEEQFGLLSMADLILSFNHETFSGKKYLRLLQDAHTEMSHADRFYRELKSQHGLHTADQISEWEQRIASTPRTEVVIRVDRFSGGQRAGMRGLLELVDEKQASDPLSFYTTRGLHFTPIGARFPVRHARAHSQGDVGTNPTTDSDRAVVNSQSTVNQLDRELHGPLL